MTQFYIPYLKEDNNYVIVNGSEFHHIVKTYRAKLNDVIKIFNGKGLVCDAEVSLIKKDEVHLKILKKSIFTQEDKFFVCLGIIKIDRFELALEKLTEIGVTDIVPLITERINVGLDNFTKRYDRFNKIIIEASKQSNRSVLPSLNLPKDLKEVFIEKKEYLDIVFDQNFTNNIFDIKKEIKESKKIRIFIGPEGGFSKEEIEFLKKQNNIFFIKVSNNTLRSETAAIICSSIVFQIKNYY